MPLSGLTLLLSGRCNLRCTYCYQEARRGRARMTWACAQAALDFLLGSGSPPLTVEFSGGEPLLEPDLLRRCVGYIAERRASAREVHLVLTTNGLLLDPELLDLLAAHDVALHLSFDGVPAAQELRTAGTFSLLDGLLDKIRKAHPAYFRERTGIHVVVQPKTVGHLSQSARYFVEKGVGKVAFYPAAGPRGPWRPGDLRFLRAQTLQVAVDGIGHWEETGSVPVLFLRNTEEGTESRNPAGPFICGAGYGKGLCVDTNGTAWTCPLFCASLQDLSPLAREVSDAVRLGDVRDPGLAARLSSLPERTASLPLLTRRAEKFSGHGVCGDCEFFADCVLCPAAISHQRGNGDPRRVPDFLCAFNRATLSARREFRSRTSTLLSGPF